MKPVDQAHTVAVDGWGDCLSACVASIVECHIEYVPQFSRINYDDHKYAGWTHHLGAWLRNRGLCAVTIRGRKTEAFFLGMAGAHVIVGGPSDRTKLGHSVVGIVSDEWGSIEFVHDPHPSRDFLHGEPDEWTMIFRSLLPVPRGVGIFSN